MCAIGYAPLWMEAPGKFDSRFVRQAFLGTFKLGEELELSLCHIWNFSFSASASGWVIASILLLILPLFNFSTDAKWAIGITAICMDIFATIQFLEWRKFLISYNVQKASSAALVVASITSSECAVETNPASNCDGAR